MYRLDGINMIGKGVEPENKLEWCLATKRIIETSVYFPRVAKTIQTLEGPVLCELGDAVVIGVQGEQWPVKRDLFELRYKPVSPTLMGMDGRYRSLPYVVDAARLEMECQMVLPDNRGVLNGKSGDWVVRHKDGSLGIVESCIFAEVYILSGNK